MQMQPYSRVETKPAPLPEQRGPVAERNGYQHYSDWAGYSNGHVPQVHPHLTFPDRSSPTYFQVLLGQVKKRWKLLMFWLILTGGVAALVLTKFAHPMWKAEGSLYYAPNFNMGQNPLYRPPNIQTVLALAKSGELCDKVAAEKGLGTGAEVLSKLNVAIVKQSDIIAVSFESPTKEKSEEVTNRVMELAIEQFDNLRRKLSEASIRDLDNDLKKALDDELLMRKKLNEMLGRKNIFDLTTERSSVINEVAHLKSQIKEQEREKHSLELKIAALEQEIKQIVAETQGGAGKLSEAEVARLRETQDLKTKLSTRREEVEKAKIKLKSHEEKRVKYLPLYRQGYISATEMGELERDVGTEKAVISEGTKAIAELENTLLRLEKTEAIPEALRLAKREKSRVEIDLGVIPARIAALQEQLEERLKYQVFLQGVEKEALQVQQQIETLQQNRNKLSSQKQDHEKLKANQMSELTLYSGASAGAAPISSNHLKLGAGTFTLSILLFLGFIALFDMPRATPTKALVPAGPPMPAVAPIPVPVWEHGPQPPPYAEPPHRAPNPINEQLRILAERIAPSANERGKIVLFTPTAIGLRLENLLGDLGSLLAKPPGKVLVFEARTQGENPLYPSWCGPATRKVSDELESYLDGRSERTTSCFTETAIPAIDYARGDLTRHLQGVMAMYRFRRLMNDMKERYSLVLMITPERFQGEEDDVFTTLGEGIVVVINQDADPSDVEAYLRELRASETPVYGAFTVPLVQAV